MASKSKLLVTHVELQVIEDIKNRLEVSVEGLDHTILNLLVKQLQQDKDVTVAAYNIEHPLVSTPKLIIETKSASPKNALTKAITSLKKENTEFGKAFAKAC